MNNEKYSKTLNNISNATQNILKDIKILNLFNSTIKNENDLVLLCNKIGVQYGGAGPNDFDKLDTYIKDKFKVIKNDKIKENIGKIRVKLGEIFNNNNNVENQKLLTEIKNKIQKINEKNNINSNTHTNTNTNINDNDAFITEFLAKFLEVLTEFKDTNSVDTKTLSTINTRLEKLLNNK
jgi:hypothetical protein